MRQNARAVNRNRTHEGAVASPINNQQKLERSVMSCMLWEDTFYEDGQSIADRITQYADQAPAQAVADLAIRARSEMHLRHVPLLLLLSLIKRGGSLVNRTIASVISRPDEITELVALYWADGKKPLSKQMKLGLGAAFNKFDEYQLAKYNRPDQIKLKDVLFMVHAKPKDKATEVLFKKLADDTLAKPKTWESRAAGGMDKKDNFTELLAEGKLGYMACLRNLRGMTEAGVDPALIKSRLLKPSGNVLPFRFISAAKHAPMYERELDQAMLKAAVGDQLPIKGKTVMLIDVSGSMQQTVSNKSEVTRFEAAGGVGISLSALCEDLRVFVFGTHEKEIAPRRGLALIEQLRYANVGHSTMIGRAVQHVNAQADYDRIIVITDEQSHDHIPSPKGKGYIVNVAPYQNGIGYGQWTHINGFSEAVVKFLRAYEGC